MFIGESSCQCHSHFECLTWETSTSYFIFLYVFQLGSLYLSLRPSRAWNCQSVWIIAFRLHICIILIMGSEVSEMVLSWLHNLPHLFDHSLIEGGSWWGGEAQFGPPSLSIYLLVNWLLIKNIYANSTEYSRSIYIINGNRF